MYLVDTNIWLERLLGQAKSDEVGQFLDHIPSNQLFITDFAFHSICVILSRLKREAALLDFVQDIFVDIRHTEQIPLSRPPDSNPFIVEYDS